MRYIPSPTTTGGRPIKALTKMMMSDLPRKAVVANNAPSGIASNAAKKTAVFFAALLAIPLGALLATTAFRGKSLIIILVNALMGLPPVVVGLGIYLMLSRSGPFGVFGLLYTPTAMAVGV